MKMTKKVIGYTLIIGGLIRIYFRKDIIYRIFERGFDEAPIMDLFIPFLVISIGIIFLITVYKKKKS